MSKQNIIKIVVAAVVVILIVVATFAYGDSQRKAQIKKGQITSTQTQQSAQSSSSAQPQGGGQAQPAPKNVPAPANGKTPQTGPELLYALPFVVIAILYFYNRDLAKILIKK
jgi:hypothetical protein